MKKDMKLNHSVSSPPTKYGGTFFVKDLLQNVNTTNRGWNLKDTLCKLFPWGWGFHVNSVFFFKNILVVTYSLMSWGSFRFTYLWAKLMEKWVKALHSELEGSCLKPRLPVSLGSYEYQAQWLTLGYWSCPLIVVQS